MQTNRRTTTLILKTRLRSGLKKEAMTGEIDKRMASSLCCAKLPVFERTLRRLNSALSTDSNDVGAAVERTASLSPPLPPALNAFSVKNRDAAALWTVPATQELVFETGWRLCFFVRLDYKNQTPSRLCSHSSIEPPFACTAISISKRHDCTSTRIIRSGKGGGVSGHLQHMQSIAQHSLQDGKRRQIRATNDQSSKTMGESFAEHESR
jgi:hypothetical protein